MATAYYNENDAYAAQWLRNLIDAGHIAPGVVDERSIEDVKPEEVFEFTQCHWFAGIGVWSHALRSAGWDDSRHVWTGSCPCQPFSSAGKRDGFADERHLWPAWNHIISECRPTVIFGEQVGRKNGLAWLDLVQADMEGLDYACGAVPAPAAGFGAPHIRERLYWCAYSERAEARGQRQHSRSRLCEQEAEGLGGGGVVDRIKPEAPCSGMLRQQDRPSNSKGERWSGREEAQGRDSGRGFASPTCAETNGFWAGAKWLPGIDGLWRPTQPGLQPVAYGIANRVGKLRAYGNAICAPQAKEFIEAAMGAAP